MTGDDNKVCVIGWPIEHSRSPVIHRYWLERYGIAGRYCRRAVASGELEAFFEELRAGIWRGANVTLPHKSAALSLSDEADEAARAVGAANTLVVRGRRVEARNTDVEGFLVNLDLSAPGWDGDGDCALVLGAGGVASAVVWALVGRGIAEVRIANRTRVHADALKARFGPAVVAVPWQKRNEALAGARLLVNATSLGMEGGPVLDLDLDAVPAEAVVNDLVYAPLETALLAGARARGLRCADGLGMLLHQAVPGFAAWFGVRPEVTDELRALVARDIEGRE